MTFEQVLSIVRVTYTLQQQAGKTLPNARHAFVELAQHMCRRAPARALLVAHQMLLSTIAKLALGAIRDASATQRQQRQQQHAERAEQELLESLEAENRHHEVEAKKKAKRRKKRAADGCSAPADAECDGDDVSPLESQSSMHEIGTLVTSLQGPGEDLAPAQEEEEPQDWQTARRRRGRLSSGPDNLDDHDKEPVQKAELLREPDPREPSESLLDEQHVVPQTGADSAVPLPSLLSSQATPGLENRTGQNSCFLNTVVQILLSLPEFRDAFAAASAHPDARAVDRSAFFAMEKVVSAMDAAGRQLTGTMATADDLKEALSDLNEEFTETGMHDATEAHEALLDALHRAVAPGGSASFITRVFSMQVEEESPGTSERLVYNCNLLYVPTAELRGEVGTTSSLLRGLRGVWMLRPPPVLVLGLVSETARASRDEIRETMVALDDSVDFRSAWPAVGVLQLVAFSAFYLDHYVAFVLADADRGQKVWVLYDDASRRVVGGLEDVRILCVRGKLDPKL